MTRLSAQTIRRLKIITPFLERTKHEPTNTSLGLSPCGYDVRLDQDVYIRAGESELASTIEHFRMPNHVSGDIKDKSTWARRFIVVQNTTAEPGWDGHLTLEISNHSKGDILLVRGTPIAQVVFEFLDEPTEQPYPEDGKYQNQKRGIQEAL